LGGQGAPLVPIGDELLFSEYDYCLNLGGFSNVSFNENGNRIAFDISPVNTVLNFYASELGFPYDDAGNLAKSGNVNQDLLKQLNDLEFYALPYPKSLGMEFVNAEILPLVHSMFYMSS
jgi:anhydro-N-acetylmuramic acid kinase